MRALVAALLLAALGGCERTAQARDDEPAVASPGPTRFEHAAMVRYHMRRHFDDLRAVEQLLISGQLDDAKARAFLLTRPEADPGMAAWEREARGVVTAASDVRTAPSIAEGCRREARLARACAACHVAAQAKTVFPASPPPPSEGSGAGAGMQLHQWATDRLWEGLVGPSPDAWHAGLVALAQASPPPGPARLGDASALAGRLQDLARAALREQDTSDLDQRAARYGELLVTCAACHGRIPVPPAKL